MVVRAPSSDAVSWRYFRAALHVVLQHRRATRRMQICIGIAGAAYLGEAFGRFHRNAGGPLACSVNALMLKAAACVGRDCKYEHEHVVTSEVMSDLIADVGSSAGEH